MNCRFCQGTEKVKTSHPTSCPFNPRNNKLIIKHLEALAINEQPFVIKNYDEYASKHLIPQSITILELFRENNWIEKTATTLEAFKFLIYRSYELNLINDLEILDILVYKLTFGSFGYPSAEYLKRTQAIFSKTNINQRKIDQNYENLKDAILNEHLF